MTSNTLKTLAGFFVTLINKYTPLDLSNNTLEGIYNYHLINKKIATSGQPTEKQFTLIRDAGYQKVINLLPNDIENALSNEAALIQGLGLQYDYIPVDFKNPSNEDFEKFVNSIKNASTDKVWIHCAANMRVSAFLYKYRRDILKDDITQAKIDLDKIWKPFGVWKKFLTQP
ncbi:MAG: protein tyrosine phosphatase family protein [Spongiibacteraceae bacterium]|nr:protein tyrosine phosphatase family protein [Spongiibacteraceae bacterium]